jgi:hypothetical protein
LTPERSCRSTLRSCATRSREASARPRSPRPYHSGSADSARSPRGPAQARSERSLCSCSKDRL